MRKQFVLFSSTVALLAFSLSGCFFGTPCDEVCHTEYEEECVNLDGSPIPFCRTVPVEVCECVAYNDTYVDDDGRRYNMCYGSEDCAGNADCINGECVTRQQGWLQMCETCDDGTQCAEAGAVCSLLEETNEQVCTRPCYTTNDCPGGFECLQYAQPGIPKQCVPITNSCLNVNLACTSDEHCLIDEVCDRSRNLCVANYVVPQPGCQADSDCQRGYSCIDQECKISDCRGDVDCPANAACVNKNCTSICQSDYNCPTDQRCYQIAAQGASSYSSVCLSQDFVQCNFAADCKDGINDTCIDARCERVCQVHADCEGKGSSMLCIGGICQMPRI